MKDVPSRRAFIATSDGGYVSASDVEGELALATNLLAKYVEERPLILLLPPLVMRAFLCSVC